MAWLLWGAVGLVALATVAAVSRHRPQETVPAGGIPLGSLILMRKDDGPGSRCDGLPSQWRKYGTTDENLKGFDVCEKVKP